VIEREIYRKIHFIKRPLLAWNRSRAFAQTESGGVEVGTWDKTILGKNDVQGY